MASSPISTPEDFTKLASRLVSGQAVPPGVRPEVVESIMDRVGVSMPPEIFQFEVARAFEVVASGRERRGRVEPHLRSCHSYPVFQQALRRAGPMKSVLILGCGEGLPGLDYEYTEAEWKRIWPDTPHLDVISVSLPQLLNESAWTPQTYDVVVSHSMIHYIYRTDLLFCRIRQVLRGNGVYVMGKEVNARFAQTPELVRRARDLRVAIGRARRRRAPFNFRRSRAFLRRLLGYEPPVSLIEGVNTILDRRLKVKRDLTQQEISRLVEVHRPEVPPSDLQIGMAGFDVECLAESYLRGFELEWFKSSGYLGYQHPTDWPKMWHNLESDLASRHEGRGIYFSACWRKGL